MAGALAYEMMSSAALLSLGVYHMVGSTRLHLKSPQTYSAKPFHPLGRLRHAQLYAVMACLAAAAAHHCLSPAPHPLTSLQSAAVCLLFLLLAAALLLSDSFPALLPLPAHLFFTLAAAFFFLSATISAGSRSALEEKLETKCESISGRVSSLAAVLCLALALKPRLFGVDLGLGGALCLKGLWALQTGLSLNVEAFIPEGCHRLLDVVGSTKCDLEESAVRAAAVLDLAFLVHVVLAFLAMMLTVVVVSGARRQSSSSYEALPTTVHHDHNHIQMKAIAGTQA